MIGFGVPLAGALLTDWPWLLGIVLMQWAPTFPAWPGLGHPAISAGELLILGAAEIVLARCLPGPGGDGEPPVLADLAAWLWLSLYLGAIPGTLAWQFTGGRGAGARLHRFFQRTRRRAALRGVRIGLGVTVIVLIATGWLPR
ncbi:MAG: hypothetical protein M0Z53_06830 [Thermaerobacter sp.]|nr:hypothetical protein [Thermaerobacter sp.]